MIPGGAGAADQDDFPSAFEAALARLQVRVERACLDEAELGWPAQVVAGICAALDFAATYPTAAQTLTSEAMAAGRSGFARYDRMIDHFAAGLVPGRAERPEGEWLPGITEKLMIGGLATLIAQRLDYGRHVELPDLAPEAIQFVLTPYLGIERARRVAGPQHRDDPT